VINTNKTIKSFCGVDDFYKEFTEIIEKNILQQNNKIKRSSRIVK